MTNLVPSTHVIVVAAVATVVTGIQLWRRFADRRLWHSRKSVGLYVAISLLSGLVSGVISSLNPSILQSAAVGTSYPFWAPRPAGSSGKPGDDPEDPKLGHERRVFGTLIDAVWGVGGYLTGRLDMHLARVKGQDVKRITDKLISDYAKSTDARSMAASIKDQVYQSLQSLVENLTDANTAEVRTAQLRGAMEKASLPRELDKGLGAYVSLAYDWHEEELLGQLFDST